MENFAGKVGMLKRIVNWIDSAGKLGNWQIEYEENPSWDNENNRFPRN